MKDQRNDGRRPCPFCGGRYTTRVPVGGFRSANRDRYYVFCPACDARGPIGNGKPEADRLWDERKGPGVIGGDGNVIEVSFGGIPPLKR